MVGNWPENRDELLKAMHAELDRHPFEKDRIIRLGDDEALERIHLLAGWVATGFLDGNPNIYKLCNRGQDILTFAQDVALDFFESVRSCVAQPAFAPTHQQSLFHELEGKAYQGDVQSQYETGSRLVDGLGCDRDEELGLEWIRIAARNGHVAAAGFLARQSDNEASVAARNAFFSVYDTLARTIGESPLAGWIRQRIDSVRNSGLIPEDLFANAPFVRLLPWMESDARQFRFPSPDKALEANETPEEAGRWLAALERLVDRMTELYEKIPDHLKGQGELLETLRTATHPLAADCVRRRDDLLRPIDDRLGEIERTVEARDVAVRAQKDAKEVWLKVHGSRFHADDEGNQACGQEIDDFYKSGCSRLNEGHFVEAAQSFSDLSENRNEVETRIARGESKLCEWLCAYGIVFGLEFSHPSLDDSMRQFVVSGRAEWDKQQWADALAWMKDHSKTVEEEIERSLTEKLRKPFSPAVSHWLEAHPRPSQNELKELSEFIPVPLPTALDEWRLSLPEGHPLVAIAAVDGVVRASLFGKTLGILLNLPEAAFRNLLFGPYPISEKRRCLERRAPAQSGLRRYYSRTAALADNRIRLFFNVNGRNGETDVRNTLHQHGFSPESIQAGKIHFDKDLDAPFFFEISKTAFVEACRGPGGKSMVSLLGTGAGWRFLEQLNGIQ